MRHFGLQHPVHKTSSEPQASCARIAVQAKRAILNLLLPGCLPASIRITHSCCVRQVAASSAVFAAQHLSGLDFVPLCVLGGVLGATLWAAEGNVIAPTCGHALYNTTILAALLTDISVTVSS